MEVSLKQAPCCPEPRFEVKHKKDLHRAAKLLILAMGVDGSHHGAQGTLEHTRSDRALWDHTSNLTVTDT